MEDWEEDSQETTGCYAANNGGSNVQKTNLWNGSDSQGRRFGNQTDVFGKESSSWNSSGSSVRGRGRESGRDQNGSGEVSDDGALGRSWGGSRGAPRGRCDSRGGRGHRGRGGLRNTPFDGDGRGRGGRGRFGGGYRGRDEDVFSGSKGELGKKASEDGENAGPKVIYVPPPPPEEESSVFAHYETGINFDKYDDILVEVSGENSPQPITMFEEAGLCESLSKNVKKSGYVKPTPVQKYGIPIAQSGRDLMACAQTGSGKTAAFLLPILQHLMAQGVAASRYSDLQEPEAVVVAPTRELINQIYLEARKFAYGTCVRPVVVYGGISTAYTIREVLKGCNILCGTPGRLLDIIGKGKVGLSKLRYLVLDEADRMLDMGFEQDMRRLVASPGMPSKEERQTLMFSATFPEDIQRLAADFLKVDYLFLAVGQVGGACCDVEQTVIEVAQYSKREQLVDLLKTTGMERTMVFVETKRKADFIATFLCQVKIPTTSIHGDREQREREQALRDFRSGKCPVLVATAVAARGLDIEHVQHVVNFDLPSTIEEYVHRIGRTGRCGNTGRAVSFFDPVTDTPLARSLVKVLAGAHQEVPSWLEEIAFGAHGTSSISPHGMVFASVDTRKCGSFQSETAQPSFQSHVVDEEEWE